MAVSLADSILFQILFALLAAMLIGVLWTWFWALRRLWLGIPLLSDLTVLPARETPWQLSSILLAVFLYLAVNFGVFNTYQFATGRRLPHEERAVPKAEARAPRERTEPAREVEGNAGEAKDAGAAKPAAPKEIQPGNDDENRALQSEGELMLQSAIINLILIVLVPSLVLKPPGAGLADLGWDTRDWHRQVLQGVRAALLITPVVFTMQMLAVRVWQPQKHLLDQMVTKHFSLGTALLAIVSAMVLAPVVEEMLFRGLLQQWLGKTIPEASDPGNLDPTVEDISSAIEDPAATWRDEMTSPYDPPVADDQLLFDEKQPEGPVPGERTNLNAIFVSSALFAGMHYLQWPAPIAIFVLSLWLGTLYARSRSLITAIALHATFNSFSTTILLLDAVGRRIGGVGPRAALDLIGQFLL